MLQKQSFADLALMTSQTYPSVHDLAEVESILQADGLATIQFDKPLAETLQQFSLLDGSYGPTIARDAYLEQLGQMCAAWGDKLTVRFFGFYSQTFDAAILREIPQVQSLIVNCIYDDVLNLDVIAELPVLKHLGLGVFDLSDKAILSRLPLHQLETLTVEETNTKALDLSPLETAVRLRRLALYGHKKNIEVIGSLRELEHLSFNPAKTVSCAFLNGLEALRTLNFVLGGKESLADVATLPAVEDIAMTMVRGLSDLGDLQRFPSLKRLLIQDQPHLASLKVGEANQALEHIWIHNCPSLSDIQGIEDCPRLTSLRAFKTELVTTALALPGSLTHASIFSGKARAEAAEKAAIEARGLVADPHPDMPIAYK